MVTDADRQFLLYHSLCNVASVIVDREDIILDRVFCIKYDLAANHSRLEVLWCDNQASQNITEFSTLAQIT